MKSSVIDGNKRHGASSAAVHLTLNAVAARARGCIAINTSTGKYAGDLQSNRRTSAYAWFTRQASTRANTMARPRYTLACVRDSVHIYTCLASASARDLRKHSRTDGRRVRIYSAVGSAIRRTERVKPRDRLFARQINICSSAVSLFARRVSLPGTRTGYVCAVLAVAPRALCPLPARFENDVRIYTGGYENNINPGDV